MTKLLEEAYQISIEFYSKRLARQVLDELQKEGKIKLEGNKIIWLEK